MANISSDVYGISEYVNEVKKNFTDVNENTLQMGIFGYLGEVFSNSIQNSVVMASEFANESIPTKAKFEKNVIAHALSFGISNINAVPAQMDILLTIIEDDLINNMVDNVFIFDHTNAIYFENYEFHTDYDIKISRVKLNNGNYTYTAEYLIDVDNPLSDITNPYLTPPSKMNISGTNAIFTKCTIRQVELTTEYKKILTDSSIDAKTFTFSFDSQLAAFTIDVTEGDTTTHMIPVYDGLTVTSSKYKYFYYTYLSDDTIRVKFDRESYMPRISSDITINIQTTHGESGNFTWNDTSYPQFVFDSTRTWSAYSFNGYTNLACEIRPVSGESLYGTDKKTIDELKSIIPKEALSRNSITNLTDLENYFNMLDTDDSKLYFYKKRDNTLERLYYTYLLLKNSSSNIIPTNTINIAVNESEFSDDGDSIKEIFRKDAIIRLPEGETEGEVLPEGTTDLTPYANDFLYKIPFNFIINKTPLYGMYIMPHMNIKKQLDFTYINANCMYQYISTYINWKREYLTDESTYKLIIKAEQNIIDDGTTVTVNADTGAITTSIRCFLVIYNSDDEPLRWVEATIKAYDSETVTLTFEIDITTSDLISTDGRIKISGMNDIGSNTASDAYVTATTKGIIHIVSTQDEEYGLNGLDSLIPGLTGASLTNSYTVISGGDDDNGLNFFYDYSEIIASTVTTTQDQSDGSTIYHITGIPAVKYNYFDDEDKVTDFNNEIITRATYINSATSILEDSFGIDFKLFNTYGPSKIFTLDNSSTYINRVNISMTFRTKLQTVYDANIIEYLIEDIKSYIEDINEISDLHISGLITYIMNKYSESIVYFEFVDMNGYGPGQQHIYNMGQSDINIVPEFVNVNTLTDGSPDITIIQA